MRTGLCAAGLWGKISKDWGFVMSDWTRKARLFAAVAAVLPLAGSSFVKADTVKTSKAVSVFGPLQTNTGTNKGNSGNNSSGGNSSSGGNTGNGGNNTSTGNGSN